MPLPTMGRPGLFRYPSEDLTDEERNKQKDWRPVDILCDLIEKRLTKRGRFEKVMIIEAGTGSGKSTLFIQELLIQIGQKYNRAIGVAEPRINLCTNGANDILSYNPKWTYGVEMGKLTGSSKIRPTKRASICFMTVQILQNYLNTIMRVYNSNNKTQYKRMLNRYLIFVVDEAHTHDLQTLSTIASIKNFLFTFNSDPLCPLFIFTSATIDLNQFIRYFELEKMEKKEIIGKVLPISNNPIEELYLTDQEVDRFNVNTDNKAIKFNDIYSQVGKYLVERFSKKLFASNVTALDGKARCRDVLILVPGIRAITSMIYSINFAFGNNLPKILVTTDLSITDFEKWRSLNKGRDRLVIMGYSSSYSPLATKLLENPFSDDPDVLQHEMRWIVSTGAIESGKTIGTLEICCDFGFDNKPMNSPLTWKANDRPNIVQIPACQNQITQRRGRVGRTAAGTFLCLYTEKCLKSRSVDDLPDTINAGCLSLNLYSLYLQPNKSKCLIDLANMNDNLFPIPPDLLISSGRDLIYSGVIGTNGEWLGEEVEELWIRYAQLAYYILRMPLYESLMQASINRYFLPTKFEIEKFDKSVFSYSLDSALKTRDSKISEFIIEARTEFMKIINHKSLSIIPYRGDWY